jgi:hypothetical protein
MVALSDLLTLPQVEETWEGELYNVACDEVHPLWLIVITDQNVILAHRVVEAAPDPELMWETLVRTMMDPWIWEPRRPARLRVHRDPRWEALQPRLNELGIEFIEMEAHISLVDGLPELMEELWSTWTEKYARELADGP